MIGLIVTGHGHFATGLTSSLELIAGAPEHYEAVDFEATDSTEDLQEKLVAAIGRLEDCTDGILILSDLAGGSPFKVSVELSMALKESRKIVVLAGTNLGMLIETNLTRTFAEDVDVLADQSVCTGKDQVIKYVFVERVEVETDDGI